MEEKRKSADWSTKVLEEIAHQAVAQWRSISQKGTMEGDVLEKYKVDEAKTGAYRGRGEPLDWRIVKKEKVSWIREYSLQRNKKCADRMARNDEENQGKGQIGRTAHLKEHDMV